MDREVKHSIGTPIEEVPLVKEAIKLGWTMTEIRNNFEWTLTKKNFGGGWDASVTLQGTPEEVAKFTQSMNGVLGGTTVVSTGRSATKPQTTQAPLTTEDGDVYTCPEHEAELRKSTFKENEWYCPTPLGYKKPNGKDAYCEYSFNP